MPTISAVLALVASGCAAGVSSDASSLRAGQGAIGGTMASAAGAPAAGASAAGAPAAGAVGAAGAMAPDPTMVDAGSPPFVGEPCVMGAVAPCVCPDTGTEGTRRCLFNPDSPTDGAFSATCESCAPPPEPEPEPEPEPDAGAPNPPMTDAGQPDPAPDPDPQPEPEPDPQPEPDPRCDPRRCDDSLILGQGCCTDRGRCGHRPFLTLICI